MLVRVRVVNPTIFVQIFDDCYCACRTEFPMILVGNKSDLELDRTVCQLVEILFPFRVRVYKLSCQLSLCSQALQCILDQNN